MKFLEVKWTKCYCGGWIREVLTQHKRLTFGWKYFAYKKPRWTIDNCYSERFE
jgi:hypothetical protein